MQKNNKAAPGRMVLCREGVDLCREVSIGRRERPIDCREGVDACRGGPVDRRGSSIHRRGRAIDCREGAIAERRRSNFTQGPVNDPRQD